MLGAGIGWGEEQFAAPQRDLSLMSYLSPEALSLTVVGVGGNGQRGCDIAHLLSCVLQHPAPHTLVPLLLLAPSPEQWERIQKEKASKALIILKEAHIPWMRGP